MNEEDRVFARFKGNKPEASGRREQLTIPGRAGVSGSRVVEVVHVRSSATMKDRPRHVGTHVRAASWDGGFQAKRAIATPVRPAPISVPLIAPTTHAMPAWGPAVTDAVFSAPGYLAVGEVPDAAARRGRGQPRKEVSPTPPARHVADPFDADDDGANCLRCGYVMEPAREKRGLMTCAGCG